MRDVTVTSWRDVGEVEGRGRGFVLTVIAKDIDPARLYDLQIKPSCATCKWAEALDQTSAPVDDGFTLECMSLSDRKGVTFLCPDALYVKPTHGCVQWEGK